MIPVSIKEKCLKESIEYFRVKHPERERLLGEVFTPTPIVLDRLENDLPGDSWIPGQKFLDPTCGNGQFLSAVLIIKMDLGHIDALEALYGVDIAEDNVNECRQRLLDIAGDSPENRAIVERNILCRDALHYDFSFGESPTEQLFDWPKI